MNTYYYRHCGAPEQVNSSCADVKISPAHLWVLEESVLLDPFNEHKSVGAVSGPVKQILHQVLMVLKDSLWTNSGNI